MAYPITDRGVIHISYGHFFQTPLFEFLYTNPSFSLNTEGGRSSVFSAPFGNADLKPQKTVSYEIGLQQQISEDMAIDITGYYKDIRNLLGTKIETIATGETHTVREFCDLAFNQVGLNADDYVVSQPEFYRPAEVHLLRGDASKAREKLGWESTCNLEQLVEMMVEHDLSVTDSACSPLSDPCVMSV